jgi:peptidoglycan hydrolase-like protein with peptidoglycan-binding domain
MLTYKNMVGILGCVLMLAVAMDAHAWDPVSGFKDMMDTVKQKMQNDTVEDEPTKSTEISSIETPSITTGEQIPDGPAMAELQTLLNTLGTSGVYSAGKPDGEYGDKTKGAIQAFQKQQGIPVDGIATYAILERARNAASGLPDGTTISSPPADGISSPAGVPDFALSQCVQSGDLLANQLMDGIYKEMTENLPIDVRPYLEGFCLSEIEYYLERLYLYLVAQGAAHARLTLVKYDALVDYYSKAGVDLGIRKDAFKRSIESLDSDLRALAENRRDGAEKLLDHFESEQAQQLLKALPHGYEELEAKYREGARELMAEALAHSISSTFYLTRSTVAAKELLAMLEFDSTVSGGFWETLKKKIGELSEGARVASFVTDKKDELTDMMMASTYAVKTLTEDIKDVPRLDQAEAERELAELREQNGVTLEEFEAVFEDQQQEQLNKVDV